jgi:hypothetical protein
LTDFPKPWKSRLYWAHDDRELEPVKMVEVRILRAIAKAFGIPRDIMCQTVKMADVKLLATEIRDLMPPNVPPPHVAPLEEVIVPWSPEKARGTFLERYLELFGNATFPLDEPPSQ